MKAPITEANLSACKFIAREAVSQMVPFTEDYGLTVDQKGSAKYDPSKGTVSVTLEFAVNGADPSREDWERHAPRHGFSPDDFGKEFKHNCMTYTIAGIAPRSPKYPILCDRSGEVYKFPTQLVLKKIGRK